MNLDLVLGNAQTVSALKTALSAGSLHHAVLLAAPAGCGANFAARALAADWLYPKGGPAADAVLRGESPEVLRVQGEGKSGGIPVAAIRAVRADIFHTALSAQGRVVHIRGAHRMAAPAANALLKVLEEPPPHTLFILTAHSAAQLPATIQSRCALYPLAPVSQDICAAALQKALAPGQDESLPALLSALYAGRIGLGLAALADENRLATALCGITAAKHAANRNTYALAALFSHYEGRAEDDREKRDALLADMTAALDAALNGAPLPDLPAIPPAVAALLIPPISAARAALAANAAPKITFAALAVNLARA